jgi:hypothetical protein
MCPVMTGPLYHQLWRLLFTALAISSVAEWSRAQAPDASGSLIVSMGQRHVLLKKTDRIMTGFVRPVGNYVEIEIADHSRVSVPNDQVAYIGETVEDIYQFKKRSVSRWAVGDHFQLTRWCIQNDLLSYAVEHYLEVHRQAPQNESVRRLGTELEQKILADDKFRLFAGLPPIPSVTSTAPGASTASATPAKPSEVTAASHSTAEGNNPEIALRFNDRVQPILINRCSQAACHGVSSNNNLRLIEPSGKSFTRISSENLRQVLKQLEHDENNVPKLIKYATQAHGLQRAPSLTAVEVGLLDELKRWIKFVENPVVSAVATQNGQTTGATLAGATQNLNPNALNALTPVVPGQSSLRSVPKAGEASEFPTGDSRPSATEIDALEAQLDRILSTRTANSPSGDPFDPAEFNRQVGKPK